MPIDMAYRVTMRYINTDQPDQEDEFLFLQDDIEYLCRDDFCYQNDTIETVFIAIDKDHVGKEKNVVIGVICIF